MKLAPKTISSVLALLVLLCFSVSAGADSYPLPPPGQSLVGTKHWIHSKSSDTLAAIARRFDLGHNAIVNANPGVDPWLPGEDTLIHLPMRHLLPDAPRKGIVINLAEQRLYYYPESDNEEQAVVITHPVGIGREAWETPLGKTRITHKIPSPAWYPPASIRKEHAENGDPLPRVVPAGPDNPLGHFALRLGMPEYLIHGTNKPRGVGMRVSHGCIRLYPEDIALLFTRAAKGTAVNIVDQPYKVGWYQGQLYLEAHPDPRTEEKKASKKKVQGNKLPTKLLHMVQSAVMKHPDMRIAWNRVANTYKQLTGMPVRITKKQPDGGAKTARKTE